MPRLSIVIPCLGGAAEFDATLVSVLQHRPADCEILVVHTEPYGDPYGLSDEVVFVRQSAHSTAELLNAGIERSCAEVVHPLACGVEATEGWTDAALAHFDDPDVLAVSPVILSPDGKELAAAGVRWSLGGARHLATDRRLLSPGSQRLRAKVVGPTLQAGFYRRETLVALDGLQAALAEHVDVDLALALRELGGLHICEPASSLVLSDAAMPMSGARGFSAGRAAERLFWRYAAQRGTAISLAFHPWTVLADTIRHLPGAAAFTTLLGRAVALFEIGATQRHQRRLLQARERLAELAELRATIRLPSREAQRRPSRRAA